MALNAGRVFGAAWRIAPRLPESLVRGVIDAGFRWAAWRGIGGAKQLRANLTRLRPHATAAEMDELVRQGMREYGRYYAETFLLPKFVRRGDVNDRVRAIHSATSLHELSSKSAVLALGHTGNWDLAGAWVTQALGTVLTVAEKLEPEELFQEFLDFRASLGMEVLAMERGQNLSRKLQARALANRRIVALVSDRDLTGRGVEVDLAGERALVAAGPAAIALAGNLPLFFVGIRSDRVIGADGRSRLGIEVEFRGPIDAPSDSADHVTALTQAWVREFEQYVTQYPASWHMLQKVFLADLDPERLARRATRD